MKQLLFVFSAITITFSACKSSGSMALIQPKEGIMELPEKGEFRIWRNVAHPSFSVTLTNPSATQSC